MNQSRVSPLFILKFKKQFYCLMTDIAYNFRSFSFSCSFFKIIAICLHQCVPSFFHFSSKSLENPCSNTFKKTKVKSKESNNINWNSTFYNQTLPNVTSKHVSYQTKKHTCSNLINSLTRGKPSQTVKNNEKGIVMSEITNNNNKIIDQKLEGTFTSTNNPLIFIERICPKKLIPDILSFAGPQSVQSLICTSQKWKSTIESNAAIWKTLCQEMYKWSDGDEVPSSWRYHYQQNLCVPNDFSSIRRALDVVTANSKRRKVRILLFPGKYTVCEPLKVNPVRNDLEVTLETIPSNRLKPKSKEFVFMHQNEKAAFINSKDVNCGVHNKKTLISRIKEKLNCRSSSAVISGSPSSMTQIITSNEFSTPGSEFHEKGALQDNRLSGVLLRQDQATLMIEVRKPNQPIIDVRRGQLKLVNMAFFHHTYGENIWLGNSAIHICRPPPTPLYGKVSAPRVVCDSVNIQSISGRGINIINGGSAKVVNSYIHDCAASGIYVGNGKSCVSVIKSDIVHNGHRMPGGHSGVCMEHGSGKVGVSDCNISYNGSAGILALPQLQSASASPIIQNTALGQRLDASNSDLIANAMGAIRIHGSDVTQEEEEEVAFQGRDDNNNLLTDSGKAIYRSNLAVQQGTNEDLFESNA